MTIATPRRLAVIGGGPAGLMAAETARAGVAVDVYEGKGSVGIEGVKAGLLYETAPKEALADPARVAEALKSTTLTLVRARPIEEAISSAGEVRFAALDDQLMIKGLRGVFCAGEMLDWEAPTGGCLLTACFASGRIAGLGAASFLNNSQPAPGR